ncbi:hypothetical protein P3X46_032288 [Hevea brasiliensis]|uniref:RNase H type-1 domain-containing protein n=1 Tax=Hevea brasiliensis TaxID=3981 RepID=A0ABQ9KCU7_HEVBR|nr:hypothetical protein P3X46_032288 [Hevea brasiliensis]
MDYLKCNVDATVFASVGKVRAGGVIRDHEGKALFVCQISFNYVPDAAITEAISFREVLSWLKMKALHNIIFESDSLVLVQAIHGSSEDLSYFGSLVFDYKVLHRELFNCFVVFARRLANCVAHLLATSAISYPDLKDWGPFPPNFVLPIVFEDLQW